MDLNKELRDRLERMNKIEEVLPNADNKIKKYVEEQRMFIFDMQHLLYKSLKEQYPCHGIELPHEMYEYYQFDIVVKPKNVSN